LNVVLVKKEEDLEKIVAVRKIRDMFRDHCAERHLKQVQAKRERWDTNGKEREAVALSYLQSVRELFAIGGKLDIEQIGKKFGIDVDFFR
jgi:hypothetical protein